MTIAIVAALVLVVVAIWLGTAGSGRVGATPAPSDRAIARGTSVAAPGANGEAARACWDAEDPASAADDVLVFFICEHPPADARPVVRPLPHQPGEIEARLRFALEQLLAGPTAEERELGYSSVFPPDSEELLIGVEFADGGIAIVDFADHVRRVNNGTLNASTPRFMFYSTLPATALQFDEIAAAEFRIEGSCLAFARYFEAVSRRVVPEG
jgi:hypothetical protein